MGVPGSKRRSNDVATARRCDCVILQAGTVGRSHGTSILLLILPCSSCSAASAQYRMLCAATARPCPEGVSDQLDNTRVPRQASACHYWTMGNGFGATTSRRSNHAADEAGLHRAVPKLSQTAICTKLIRSRCPSFPLGYRIIDRRIPLGAGQRATPEGTCGFKRGSRSPEDLAMLKRGLCSIAGLDEAT